ncbi:hypothetical protein LJC46_04340 [Desulfovibrio sp. OttesenSCG-928-G15]|nr:hypothetical protein [Desulfovibrio sp. OttesenSCG-928-G15]
MYKSPLKVFGEYLVPKTAAAASIAGDNVVRAGKSMSGLEIVVCVEPSDSDPDVGFDVAVGDTVTISLLQSMDGETFVALPEWKQTIAAPEDDPTATTISARPGDIIARMTIPYDCMQFIKGNLAFSAAPVGNVSMFPAYLPR